MEDAKLEFEEEREKILSELPDSIKAMFGQIGFTAADPPDSDDEVEEDDDPENDVDDNGIIPVLVVSPYDVPPKPVRDVYWFDMFSKGKRTKTLTKLPHLVYHYGSNDPDDCYSFIEQDDFISYQDGIAKGFDNLPTRIVNKIKNNALLSGDEQILVRGLQEMKEDCLLEPNQRKRGVLFQERHELLKSNPNSSTTTSSKASKSNSNKRKKSPPPPPPPEPPTPSSETEPSILPTTTTTTSTTGSTDDADANVDVLEDTNDTNNKKSKTEEI